jgi:hypothetical protein
MAVGAGVAVGRGVAVGDGVEVGRGVAVGAAVGAGVAVAIGSGAAGPNGPLEALPPSREPPDGPGGSLEEARAPSLWASPFPPARDGELSDCCSSASAASSAPPSLEVFPATVSSPGLAALGDAGGLEGVEAANGCAVPMLSTRGNRGAVNGRFCSLAGCGLRDCCVLSEMLRGRGAEALEDAGATTRAVMEAPLDCGTYAARGELEPSLAFRECELRRPGAFWPLADSNRASRALNVKRRMGKEPSPALGASCARRAASDRPPHSRALARAEAARACENRIGNRRQVLARPLIRRLDAPEPWPARKR